MNFWQGEKVRLRAVEPADWKVFVEWNRDSERARHLHFVWPPESSESVKIWAQEQSKRKLEDDTFTWIIENKEGDAVGAISSHNCDHRNGTFSYSIAIASEHRRKGYATEAIQMVLRYYFEELRYEKITVDVHSNNPASIGLHKKLGFMKEGVLRHMVFTEGRYYDILWYGMTQEEFESLFGRR